jgi:cephalosporin hydroxylase
MDNGTVLSIDKDRSGFNLKHPRVIELTGETAHPEILQKVRDYVENRQTLIIHDADHRYPAVFEDLKNYSEFVSVGSYFIVEDGIVDLYHYDDGLGFKEPGPLAAIEDFLKTHPNFESDAKRERYRLTYNPKGYLKRIS